jgi:hypothetical protein
MLSVSKHAPLFFNNLFTFDIASCAVAERSSDFHFSANRVCLCNSIVALGRLGKYFIDFFLVGEQLLDARALLRLKCAATFGSLRCPAPTGWRVDRVL